MTMTLHELAHVAYPRYRYRLTVGAGRALIGEAYIHGFNSRHLHLSGDASWLVSNASRTCAPGASCFSEPHPSPLSCEKRGSQNAELTPSPPCLYTSV